MTHYIGDNQGRETEGSREISRMALLGLLWWLSAPLRWLMKGKK